jgi:hypothetical protein
MSQRIASFTLAAAMVLGAGYAFAKIPPPPPPTDEQKAAAEAKKEKDKAAAEKAKADLTAAEDRAIANYQQNMRKEGKPIPKPIPVAAQSTPPSGAQPKPQGNTVKAAEKEKGKANAASGGTSK